jgi:putative Mn2+ efflux pump MntP
MDPVILLGTALGLAMDAFAVSVAVTASLPQVTGRHTFRLAWHFGLFQFLMPVLGWLGGAAMQRRLALVDHWIAFGLLGFLGARMIWNSGARAEDGAAGRANSFARAEGAPAAPKGDPTRGWSLVALSVATSVDALAVGLSLGLLRVTIWIPSAVIGLVALALTFVGTRIGPRVGRKLGPWAERVGGVVLCGIGLRILIQHLAAG